MFFSTLFFFSLTPFLSYGQDTDRRYECGAHGRFEYCIDGIPGCVVGCHCHPGYYFDTNSKICEPNFKLQQEFRRHMEVQTPTSTPIATVIIPTPTETRTDLDEQVDEIAKNTDDIGDWLYNQFFKAVENQVINQTIHDEPIKLTRRSGSSPPSRKIKRKSRKFWKDSKKKKGKARGLRKKLLRITEDDSLFDSGSSSSTSDESSPTSSESDSSDTTSESEGKKDDKGHGHSTILMVNKKPKPPLPSFIFLPHMMDTPYYPPIGLPPPPMLPMYPVAPIPPMAPMFPYLAQHQEECDHSKDTATKAGPTLAVTTEPVPNNKDPKDPATKDHPKGTEPSHHPESTEPPHQPEGTEPPHHSEGTEPSHHPEGDGKPSVDLTEAKPTRSNVRRGKKDKKGKSHTKEPNSESVIRSTLNKESRNKLIHKLREKMKYRRPVMEQFMDISQGGELPIINDLPSEEIYTLSKKMYLKAMEDRMSEIKDVDFKYLSDLIHRTNLNDTSKVPSHPVAPYENIKDIIQTGQTSRRSYQNDHDHQYTQPIKSFKQPNNLQKSDKDTTFYSNLGKQIATLIRKIDSKGEREVNIEIERTNPTIANNNILNENRYNPRSYWERSVRSPLHYFKQEYMNPSNEKLFSLENEVENAASTRPSLSLQDLEDILSTMTKKQFQNERNVMSDEPKRNANNTSLNINLLPEHEISKIYKKMIEETPKQLYKKPKQLYEPPKYDKFRSSTTPKPNEVIITENSDTINKMKFQNNRNSETSVPSKFWWLDMVQPVQVKKPEINKPIPNIHSMYDIRPTRRSPTDEISTTVETIQSIPKRHHVEYLKFIKTLSHRAMQQTTKKPSLNYQSQVLNYYFPGSNNDYGHDQRPILDPQHFASLSRTVNNKQIQKPFTRPSYFHHELHHFDYFD